MRKLTTCYDEPIRPHRSELFAFSLGAALAAAAVDLLDTVRISRMAS